MRQFTLKLRKLLLYDSLYLILIIISLIYIFIYSKIFQMENKCSDNKTFQIKIKNYDIDGNKLSLEFDNLIGTYYFKSKEEIEVFKEEYSLNDTISINATLSKPKNNTIPNTFNYNKYLYHKKIEYILNIESIKKIKDNANMFYKIKNYIIKRIEKIDNNEYLYAFILGKSSYINNENYENYKINGVTHLFALSGLHVTLFSGIILGILKRMKFNEEYSCFITSIFLIFFSFIAGFTPSILRAVIFFILSSINKIYYLFIKPKNILYLTFIILIMINPFYIYNTGFILSFTITYFILLLNENIKIEGNIKSILIVSFLSFLSSLPIVINLSYEINIIGFINNIIFIPLVTNIIFPFSLIVLINNKLSLILHILTKIMEYISSISSHIINITIYFQKLSSIEIILYYCLLLLGIKKSKKILWILLLLLLFIYIKPYTEKSTTIYFIDVSQGDSTLIRTRNNKGILIDTGGKISYQKEWSKKNNEFNLMTSSIIPFIKSIGLKKIDYLFLTHGDSDHAGYAGDLINNFKVLEKYTNKGNKNSLEKKLNINSFNDKYIKIDNVEIYSLNDKIYYNENKDSLVLLIIVDNIKLLFMADASIEIEKDILSKYDLGDIDILKVGHHGSYTSTSKEFVDRINPKYSIISVGKNNKFNHPNDSVLENLKKSKIYRTDKDGSVIFKIKNSKLDIKTYMP